MHSTLDGADIGSATVTRLLDAILDLMLFFSGRISRQSEVRCIDQAKTQDPPILTSFK